MFSLREFFVKRQTGSLRAVCLVDVDTPIWIVIGTECELGRSLPEATGADEALMQSFVEALRSHRAGAHVLLVSKNNDKNLTYRRFNGDEEEINRWQLMKSR